MQPPSPKLTAQRVSVSGSTLRGRGMERGLLTAIGPQLALVDTVGLSLVYCRVLYSKK